MLILTLNKLERNGFVVHSQTDAAVQPNTYMLTPLGRSLLEQMSNLHHWMAENAPAVQASSEAAQASRDKT